MSHRFRRLAIMVTGKGDGRSLALRRRLSPGLPLSVRVPEYNSGTSLERFSWNTVAEALPDIHTLGTALALICYVFSQIGVL